MKYTNKRINKQADVSSVRKTGLNDQVRSRQLAGTAVVLFSLPVTV